MRTFALLLALAALVTAGAACARAPTETRAALEARDRVHISGVAEVGPYLDATLTGEAATYRFFFPDSSACRSLLVEGGEARYRVVGPFGTLRGEEGVGCEPVGVASLAAWRDALPRRRSEYLVPRVQAAFHPVQEEGALLLLRGRFPLALEIRWPEPMDSVAVLPDVAACRALLAVPTATMEFHARGADAFVLVGAAGPCPVLGFALPLAVR